MDRIKDIGKNLHNSVKVSILTHILQAMSKEFGLNG